MSDLYEQLRRAYQDYWELPLTQQFSFTSSFSRLHAPLKIYFYAPPQGSKEDDISLFHTAGLSAHTSNGLPTPIELGLEIAGTPTLAEQEQLAEALAGLCVKAIKGEATLVSKHIVRDVALPFFRPRHALLMPWDYHYSWQVGQPAAEVLRLLPIGEQEVETIHQKGAGQAVSSWLNDGVNFTNPQR